MVMRTVMGGIFTHHQSVGSRSSDAPVMVGRHAVHGHHETTVQIVVARVALDQIGADPAVQDVIAQPARNSVVPIVSRLGVVAGSTGNSIIPGVAEHFVVAIAAV